MQCLTSVANTWKNFSASSGSKFSHYEKKFLGSKKFLEKFCFPSFSPEKTARHGTKLLILPLCHHWSWYFFIKANFSGGPKIFFLLGPHFCSACWKILIRVSNTAYLYTEYTVHIVLYTPSPSSAPPPPPGRIVMEEAHTFYFDDFSLGPTLPLPQGYHRLLSSFLVFYLCCR